MKHKMPSAVAAKQEKLQENIISLMKDKPEVFLNAMSEAAQIQQEKSRQDMETKATELKDKLLAASIRFGSEQPGAVRFFAFIDPMCPHCVEYQKIAYTLLKSRSDVAFYMLPIAVLGPNSEAMAKFMVAGAKLGPDKLRAFQEKFVDMIADMTRPKLLELAKTSGFDLSALEKAEVSPETTATLNQNAQYAEQMKIGGVPTVYVINPEGKLKLVPPMSIDGFAQLIDHMKNDGKSAPAATAPAPAATPPVAAPAPEPQAVKK